MGAVLQWWLALGAMGALAYPLVWRICRALPDRGLSVAHPVGLLLVSYGFWLLVSLGFLQNRVSGILLVMVLVAAGSAWVWRRDGDAIVAWLSEQRRLALTSELVFLGALTLFAAFRAYNPEIAATEKPMEFAFLNGILRSDTFPPRDPWLAGYGISYYYFGYVMMAMMTRLAGVIPGVGFNLMGSTLFAMTVSGAYGLGHNLMAARSRKREGSEGDGWALGAGGLTALMVAVMGNLEGIFELIRARGWGSNALWRWLDVKNLAASEPSRFWYPDDMWWWWRASRVIHDRDAFGNSMEVISEFPAFSFLLGDNHPHVLALPFVLVALALALNLLLDDRAGSVWRLRWPGGWTSFCAYGLIIGGLGFLNTWDLPLYLAMIVAAYLLGEDGRSGRCIWRGVGVGAVLSVLSFLLYLPFYLSFRSQAGGIGLVIGVKTKLHQHLLMFGIQVVWLVPALLALVWRVRWRSSAGSWNALDLIAAGGLAIVTAMCAIQGWWTAWLGAVLAGVSMWVLAAWWTRRADGGMTDAPTRLALAMVALAGALVVFCEFLFLRDVFGTRMNTVFKFYYQVWVLLGVASIQLALRGLDEWRPAKIAGRAARWSLVSAAALAMAAGMLYTVAAVPAKAGGFSTSPTLDGTAYLREAAPDEYAAIQWLCAHARDDDVLLEAPGGSYSEFNRLSAWTGVPTLLGWTGHELQWRGNYDVQGERDPDIAAIYQGSDLARTEAILDAYGIDLVVVGPRERSKYGVSDVTLQKLDAILEPVYENRTYVIYGRGR
jgi:YYY domain-containing protein